MLAVLASDEMKPVAPVTKLDVGALIAVKVPSPFVWITATGGVAA